MTMNQQIVDHLINCQLENIQKQPNIKEPAAKKPKLEQVTELILVTHNVHGIKENEDYTNTLTMCSNILFICEHWATTHAQLEKYLTVDGKRILSFPAKKAKGKGRPAGGIAFIIDEDFNCEVLYIKEKAAAIRLNSLVIIGVYCTYFDGSSHNKTQLEQELATIKETILIAESIGNKCIIVGDFNIDLSKNNSHTNVFKDFLTQTQYTTFETKFAQEVSFTYKSPIGQSWNDHICAHSNNTDIVYVKILTDKNCMSDHLPIELK